MLVRRIALLSTVMAALISGSSCGNGNGNGLPFVVEDLNLIDGTAKVTLTGTPIHTAMGDACDSASGVQAFSFDGILTITSGDLEGYAVDLLQTLTVTGLTLIVSPADISYIQTLSVTVNGTAIVNVLTALTSSPYSFPIAAAVNLAELAKAGPITLAIAGTVDCDSFSPSRISSEISSDMSWQVPPLL